MQVRLIKILSLDTLNLKKMWGYKVANTDTNIANNANSVSLNLTTTTNPIYQSHIRQTSKGFRVKFC